MSDVQKLLIERFWPTAKTKEEENILVLLGVGAQFYGIEDDLLAFIEHNPNTSILELGQFLPQEEELEVVDDAELED